jgi:glutathione reductase (NADPH)
MSLPIPGNENLITSTDFLNLERLPQRVTFIGGGFITFEFAHFAARLGASSDNVHIIEVMDRPLGPFDSDMVEQLLAATRAEGIHIHLGNAVRAIEKNNTGFVVSLESGTTIETDIVVHGAGRIPDIDTLNLRAAGITSGRQGIIVDQQMKTSNSKVYAVGDCAATVQLARVADYEAHVAAAAIIAQDHNETLPSVNYAAVPALLFTYPQLGMVGKTEDELIREGVKYWKSFDTKISWPTYKRIGMKYAAYKVIVDEESKILGAHVISDNAAGVINTFKQAMLDDKGVEDLYQDNVMSPYPSRESDIIYMLDSLRD